MFGRGEFIGAQVILRSWELERAVGERSGACEARAKARRGGAGSENADTSSDKPGENPGRRKPKVSWARFVLPGLAGS